MATDPPIHPTEMLTTPTGDQVDIDTEMVPVIRELWRLGFTTTACCQDVGEATAGVRAQRDTPLGYGGDGFIAYHRGYALVKMPVPDAQRLAALLAETVAFGDRIRRPWSVGSWRMNVPLEPEGLAAEALLHFPCTQIAELIDALRR
ncbi:hypothetical protein [Streptomyces sp. HC307]|uniref:hypothetical protein n=1 Tax=Streptomyces flavusporus TaxID=3385496 RepID=UPI003917031D